MTTRQKLFVIQKATGLTQTEIARRIGVSFVAFNNWWRGKSVPRARYLVAIDELYKECTGQKEISASELEATKGLVLRAAGEHRHILKTIISSPDIIDQFILSLTYNSNRIEGSTLSEHETAAVLFHNKALPDKSLIEQMEAKNHQAALNYLFSYLETGGKIDEELALKLHSILMNGIRNDAGCYRTHPVRIVGSNVPAANYLKVPVLVKDLLHGASRVHKDIIAYSAVFHSAFERIHPFSDGNGRLGRLLMTALLLAHDIAPAVISQRKKQLYYTVLNKAQLKDDHTALEMFLCEAILDGYAIVRRKTIPD